MRNVREWAASGDECKTGLQILEPNAPRHFRLSKFQGSEEFGGAQEFAV